MIVGVLAFQGNFSEHMAVLHKLGVPSLEVRTLDDLSKVQALVIPGGESTVIAAFLKKTGMGSEIRRRVWSTDHPLWVFGTCAGAIVLATRVTGKNAPSPLRLIDMTVDRNAYGTQINSFELTLKIRGLKKSFEATFIRAPIITKVGKHTEVLSRYEGNPVLVRQGRVVASTFHTETTGETCVHTLFIHQVLDELGHE